MNLEELKNLWQSQLSAEVEFHLLSDGEIAQMLQKRSQSALGRINRNIRMEMGLVLLIGLIAGSWLYLRETELNWFEKMIVPLYILFSAFFYWIKYRALNRKSITTENLKISLTVVSRTMGIFMKIYSYTIVFLVPVLASGGILYGLSAGGADKGKTFGDISISLWAIIGGIMVLYSIVAVWVSKWYINKIYGVHYRELQQCLDELEQE